VRGRLQARDRRLAIPGLVALVSALLPLGCGTIGSSRTAQSEPEIDMAVYRRAEVDRAERLEAEVRRLRADLRKAEEALVRAESGLRGTHSRADAVSSVAEARIELERVAADAPWRTEQIAEARGKLDEADHQIEEGHFGVALFFVHRANGIANELRREVEALRGRPNTLYVGVENVNLRAGPSTTDDVVAVLGFGTPVFPEQSREPWVLVRVGRSGSVGWVHRSLLRAE
jgi:hypothetical protein